MSSALTVDTDPQLCGGKFSINPFGANPTKWSNTLKQFVGNLPKNYLSMFDHFVNLVLKKFRRVCNSDENLISELFKIT